MKGKLAMSQGRHRLFGTVDSTEAIGGTSFDSVLAANLQRRGMLKGMAALPVLSFASLVGCGSDADAASDPLAVGFKSLPISRADTVTVPSGYTATPFAMWGDPVSNGPAWKGAANTAAEQEQQLGMHHDGMFFFPLPFGSNSSTRGLLAINHEYTGIEYLFADGKFDAKNTEQLNKALAAVGVGIVEVALDAGKWNVVRPSTYGRRITGSTVVDVSGPAAGTAAFSRPADTSGNTAIGTQINCGSGPTPWGTYLTCEETTSNRYDASQPATAYGWVVEIDPYEPTKRAVKRTAMGRFAHENAAYSIAVNNQVAFYMGDDARFEGIYKFVTAAPYSSSNRAANAGLLDSGTLYVAKFNDDGSGTWIPLKQGNTGLTADKGFASQADVMVKAREATRAVGGTLMDRPEWFAVNPKDKSVYVTLTNNTNRGVGTNPGVNPANPRSPNTDGHVIKMIETGSDPLATTFRWEIFILAGDANLADAARKGNLAADVALSSPDCINVDPMGRVWIQSDYDSTATNMQSFGNCMMTYINPVTKEARRFLTGPNGCEITGLTWTPDMKTLFINIQHPGEDKVGSSTWPHGNATLPPRSGTVVIRKDDGGVIGS
jgi:uncharacterized protein